MFRKKLFPRQASILGTKDWSLIGGHEFRCDSTQQILLLVRPVSRFNDDLKQPRIVKRLIFAAFAVRLFFKVKRCFSFSSFYFSTFENGPNFILPKKDQNLFLALVEKLATASI